VQSDISDTDHSHGNNKNGKSVLLDSYIYLSYSTDISSYTMPICIHVLTGFYKPEMRNCKITIPLQITFNWSSNNETLIHHIY